MRKQSQRSIFATQHQLNMINSARILIFATGLSHSCWPAIINPFTNWLYSAKFSTLSRKFTSDFSISQAKFSQSLDPHFIFVWYFRHNQIIKIITVTSNYAKFIKIYVLYLHVNKNKNMMSHCRYKQVGTRALEQNHQCSLTKFILEVCISAHGEINKHICREFRVIPTSKIWY